MSDAPVGSLVERLIRPEIYELAAYYVPDSSGLIKLDAMENPYPLPESVQQLLAAKLQAAAINRYPDPQGRLVKQALRNQLVLPDGYDVLLGNGSDEIIQMLMLACVQPNASVLAPVPSFVMYQMVAKWCGLTFHGVRLQDDFSLDMSAMRAAIIKHQPALIFLAYPNNPTGNCFAKEDIAEIFAVAEGLVVIDEAYAPFSSESCADWLGQYPNLLLMRTLSKLGLAGLRLGYLAGSTEWLLEFDKVRMPYNINVLTQVSVATLMEHGSVFAEQAEQICQQREALLQTLSELGLEAIPSQANFILLKVGDAAPKWFEALREAGVLVKCLHGGDPLLAGCLRITIGTAEENAFLIKCLESIVT